MEVCKVIVNLHITNGMKMYMEYVNYITRHTVNVKVY